MGLVHEMQLWALTAVILSIWWATEWSWNGGSGASASTSEAFRNYIANSMLVHDEYTQEGYNGPGLIKWMLELEASQTMSMKPSSPWKKKDIHRTSCNWTWPW